MLKAKSHGLKVKIKMVGIFMSNYYVQIKEYQTDNTIKEVGPYTEHRANKVDGGLNVNLNHDKYFTLITQK